MCILFCTCTTIWSHIKIQSLQVKINTTKREGWANVNNSCHNHNVHHIISSKIHTKIISYNYIQNFLCHTTIKKKTYYLINRTTAPLLLFPRSLIGEARTCHFLLLSASPTNFTSDIISPPFVESLYTQTCMQSSPTHIEFLTQHQYTTKTHYIYSQIRFKTS